MRKVIMESQCSKKALKVTRSILDAYLNRSGTRSWRGNLTEKSLENIRSELSHKASRNTSIACSYIENGHFKLLWIVGLRKNFNSTGSIPIKVSNKGHKSLSTKQDFPHFYEICEMLSLAGISHDFGKNNKDFIRKILNKEILKDPVRHDDISVRILQNLISNAPKPESISNWENFPIKEVDSWMELVYWIVYTHHRLPKGEWTKKYTTENHVTDEFYKYEPHSLPQVYENYNIKTELDKCVTNVKSFSLPFDENKATGMFLWMRLAIMLADHYVSSELTLEDKNSTLPANPKTDIRPAQDLTMHNREVSRFSVHAFYQLMAMNEKLPRIEEEDMVELRKQGRGKFAWQNAVSSLAQTVEKQDGFIAFLTCETGYGKTVGAAKIVFGKNSRNRVTVCLPLRSLTMQTGDAWREKLKMSKTNCVSLIGSDEVKKLHNIKINDDEDESDDKTLIEQNIGINSDISTIINHAIKNKSRFISTPAVISTIDYMEKGARTKKSSFIVPMLRLIGSDLIVDELDEYSNESTAAVGRLIFYAALFGSRVIICSATLAPEIAKKFAEIYKHGWKIRNSLGYSGNCHMINAHNRIDPVKTILSNVSTDVTEIEIEKFYKKIVKKLVPLDHRKAIFINSNGPSDISSIEKTIEDFTENHHTTMKDKKISIGLIRISQTKYLGRLKKELRKSNVLKKSGWKTYFILYHSRLPLFVRSCIEKDMDKALSRKIGWEERFGDTQYGKKIFSSAHEKVRIIVLATPVADIGRDHDYDWGIFEPSSTRSIVQLTGRVQRHRENKINYPNIAILKFNWHGTFNKPGLEPIDEMDPVIQAKWDNERDVEISLSKTGATLLPTQLFLPVPEDSLTKLEREKIKLDLDESLNPLIENTKFIVKSDFHENEYMLRRKEYELDQCYYCISRKEFFYYIPPLTRNSPESHPLSDGIVRLSKLIRTPTDNDSFYSEEEINERWLQFIEVMDWKETDYYKIRDYFKMEIGEDNIDSITGLEKTPWEGNLIDGTYVIM